MLLVKRRGGRCCVLLLFLDEPIEDLEQGFVLNKLLVVREDAVHEAENCDKKAANI